MIDINDYHYHLPAGRIAKYPLPRRDQSSLLVYREGNLSHRPFHEMLHYFDHTDLLVFNNTMVVRARIIFHKETGSRIEIFCLEPSDPSDYQLAFMEDKKCIWKCMVGNLKKWKNNELQKEILIAGEKILLTAKKTGHEKNVVFVEFSWDRPGHSFGEILDSAGTTPIPPYLEREAELSDVIDYQTIYSKREGSVAAPTAGLHFTPGLLKRIGQKKIKKLEMTLHVGAGTFQPVSAAKLADHPMHAEHFYFSRKALKVLLSDHKRITAVGTTTTRILESLYWLGSGLLQSGDLDSPLYLDQWEAYRLPETDRKSAMKALLEYLEHHGLEEAEAITRMMIVPGYKFRMVQQMITNFHMPKSTLLLLIAAFIGDDWKDVYQYALENGFRFLSYGDSSLLIPSAQLHQ